MTTDPNPVARTAENKTQEIEGRILAFLRREVVSPEVNLQREDDLLSGEILDSIAVVRLGAFIEEEFQLALQPTDFILENFHNIAVLAAFVLRVAEQGSSSAGSG